jgi:YVTN family beta-propeller protein
VSDLERLLKDSLRSVGEGFHPSDPPAARERFLRQRRGRTIGLFAGGTVLAGAAAALAVIAFWSLGTTPERDVPVASTSTDAVVSASIDVGVGSEPSGVGSGAGYVWVANSGSGTVSKVDPATNEVEREIDMGFAGAPDDVVVRTGWVWVVSDAGELARIEPDRGVVEPVATVGDGGHLDIAPGTGEDLWLLETGGDAYQFDGATGEELLHLPGGEDPTDVSTSDGTVWIYDRGAGEVISYDVDDGRELDRITVGSSKYADLSAGEGYTWFYRGFDGTLLQIEQETGSVLKEHVLGGTFGAISIGPDAVYALVVDGGSSGSGRGELFRFDADDSTRLGKTVPLADLPFDVDWGQDAIWITNNSGDTVTRIDLVPKGTTPSPDPTPEVAFAEAIFYYAAGGDIRAYNEDGSSEAVTDTNEVETSPSVAPDGSALVFQRGEGPEAKILYLPLTEDAIYGPPGEETVISDGEAPSFGPDGRLAWATLPKNGPAITHVSVGTIGTDDRIDIPVDSGLGPFTIHRIEWTSDAGSLFFHASYEGDTIYRADVPPPGGDASNVVLEEVVPIEEGAAFVSPAIDGADALHLIRLCCGTYPEWGDLTTADLGVVRNGTFEKTLGLDDLGWEPSFDVVASWAGGLDYESAAGWSVADKQTWFVTNQEELWLIDAESREMDNLELSGVVAVEPVPGAVTD